MMALSQVPSGLSPSYVRGTFGRYPCALASEAGGKAHRTLTRQQMAAHRHLGWSDLFVVNGLDPTDHGLWIGLPLARATALTQETITCWTRIAVHLAAATRLRNRLAGEKSANGAEAVIDPQGGIVHANGTATAREARRALSDSVRSLERLRSPKKRDPSPGRALAAWKGLVDTRWTLVDHFETDGKRYLVAQCNEVPTPDASHLTERERQVLAFATLGHSNKLIAYELGISPSTVAVFLHHAARKLRVSSRKELIARFGRPPPHKPKIG